MLENNTNETAEGREDEKKSVSKRGFRSMSVEERKRIASLGGKASGGNFARNPKRASEAGRRGGLNSHRGKSKQTENENIQNSDNTSE